MKRTKKLAGRIAALAAASALTISCLPISALAYDEMDVSTSTFKSDTDNSTAFQTWRNDIWETTGDDQISDSGKIALTPGTTAKDLNFAWYSVTKGTPAVMVWKDGQKSSAMLQVGTASDITAENWQGSTYAAANKVSIKDYFEENTEYHYQYTDNYVEGGTAVWSSTYDYTMGATDSFSVILTGDPQVGASGSSTDENASDDSVARDTYNWNLTVQQALATDPDAAFLLSAGDQIDKSGATSENNKKTRESEYAGYLYPSVFRSLPIASTIGNHDMAGADYSNHFNNPNASSLGATAAGGDYYFSYGDVLFISLNSNNRNQEEHRTLMEQAVESDSDAKWKVVIFHSDIYGSGEPHADTDASTNRIIFAPLMDEFDIDICLTGHDHTYSRSYQILDGNVIDYDISDGSVTDPDGTLYITTGSGSGSKYYNLLNYTPYYIAERTNDCLPAFSTIDFTSTSLTIKTYDYTGAKYADDFTINKTDSESSAEEVIKTGEAALADIDTTKYTQESILALEKAVAALKALQTSYTTASDDMVSEIVTKYGTDQDRVKGYGSIANAEDKDQGTENRFKMGLSALLDKTIYAQDFQNVNMGAVNTISAQKLVSAKSAVVTAINSLELKQTESTTTEENTTGTDNSEEAATTKENTTATDEGISAPQTGDSGSITIIVCVAAMMAAVGVGIMVFGKREKD